ncbi:hypothetical protein A8713_04420 [Streptomyces sp. SAT1]|nr:hypothetical protein [Streptomyces sp. SAT1]ANH90488.1 hypothetical protein A8713_04420 [Streptomyces sp. SAT1]
MARVHRTTTAATLLITLAVSALTGCVTVQRPPSGVPATASAAGPAPRPEGGTGPRAVQAPAREALERAGSSDGPTAPDARPRTHTPAAPPATPAATGSAARDQHPAPRSTAPGGPGAPGYKPGHETAPRPPHPPAPRHTTPAARHAVPANPGICALGKEYGHWRPGSPEAKICGQTYGR